MDSSVVAWSGPATAKPKVSHECLAAIQLLEAEIQTRESKMMGGGDEAAERFGPWICILIASDGAVNELCFQNLPVVSFRRLSLSDQEMTVRCASSMQILLPYSHPESGSSHSYFVHTW